MKLIKGMVEITYYSEIIAEVNCDDELSDDAAKQLLFNKAVQQQHKMECDVQVSDVSIYKKE